MADGIGGRIGDLRAAAIAAGRNEWRRPAMDEIVALAASGDYHVVKAEIGPELAAELLRWNQRNRPLRKGRAEAYADDMRNGRWIDRSGQTIGITSDCDLNDGQHRLHAVILAGHTIRILLVIGLDADAYSVTDKGAKRTESDTLHKSGEMNTTVLATSIKTLAAVLDGGRGITQPMSTRARMAFLDGHPTLRDDVNAVCGRTGLRAYASPATFSVFRYMCIQAGCSEESVGEFLAAIKLGAGMDENDPRLKLRNRLVDLRGKGDRLVTYALIVKAWNAHVAGRPVGILAYKAGVEALPVPVGPRSLSINGAEVPRRPRQAVQAARGAVPGVEG